MASQTEKRIKQLEKMWQIAELALVMIAAKAELQEDMEATLKEINRLAEKALKEGWKA